MALKPEPGVTLLNLSLFKGNVRKSSTITTECIGPQKNFVQCTLPVRGTGAIRSLHYFFPVIEEMQISLLSASYVKYLRRKPGRTETRLRGAIPTTGKMIRTRKTAGIGILFIVLRFFLIADTIRAR